MKALYKLFFLIITIIFSLFIVNKVMATAINQSSTTNSLDENISAVTPGTYEFNTDVPSDGVHRLRHVIVYVPEGLPNTKVPVVFMFHGSNQSAQHFYDMQNGWRDFDDSLPDNEKFIVAFPDALRYEMNNHGVIQIQKKWNDGLLTKTSEEDNFYVLNESTLADDAGFVVDMIDYLTTNFNADPDRIFGTGFSNGATFVSFLAIVLPEYFAALAPSGGFLNREIIELYGLPSKNIPVFALFGSEDHKALDIIFGDLSIPIELGYFPYPVGPETIDAYFLGWNIKTFVRALGLIDTCGIYDGITELLPDCEFKQADPDKNYQWAMFRFSEPKDGISNNEFRFKIIEGMGHIYPHRGWQPTAPEMFWEFFKSYMPSSE